MTRNMKGIAYQYMMVAIGSAIFGAGLNAFILPHKLVGTGVSGISLFLYYLTDVSVGAMNLILNIPIMWATWRFLGKAQMWPTIYGTLISSWFINYFDFLQYMHLLKDPIISSMIAGLVTGVGLGIVYRVGGNTGGLDPIGLIIRKYYGIQIGSALFGVSALVLVASIFVVGLEPVAVTLISLYVYTLVTNKIVTGFNQRKVAFIITTKTNAICEMILNDLGRGATILNSVGAYTRAPRDTVMIAISLMQVNRLKEAVDKVDPSAFMLITDAAEVIGQGFTKPINPTNVEEKLAEEYEKSLHDTRDSEMSSK